MPEQEMTPEKLAHFLTTVDRSSLLQRAQAAQTMQRRHASRAVVQACEELCP
jgi:UDP-N-acetylglucosamine:LPS N-acetylglucosamine transferase